MILKARRTEMSRGRRRKKRSRYLQDFGYSGIESGYRDSLGHYIGPIEETEVYPKEDNKEIVVADGKPASKDVWHTGTEADSLCAKDCSWDEKNVMGACVIRLSEKVGDAIAYLIRNVHVEWQLLLCGEVIQEGDTEVVNVTGYYIPKQEVGSAHVSNLDCIDQRFIAEKGIIATIHSHSTMDSFFSETDRTECNSSPIQYHAVINNRYEYSAVKQRKLGCGMFRFKNISLEFVKAETERPDGFENIEISKYSRGTGNWGSVNDWRK